MNKNLAFRKIDDKIPLFYVHNKLVCDSICVATTIEKKSFLLCCWASSNYSDAKGLEFLWTQVLFHSIFFGLFDWFPFIQWM